MLFRGRKASDMLLTCSEWQSCGGVSLALLLLLLLLHGAVDLLPVSGGGCGAVCVGLTVGH